MYNLAGRGAVLTLMDFLRPDPDPRLPSPSFMSLKPERLSNKYRAEINIKLFITGNCIGQLSETKYKLVKPKNRHGRKLN
jgi:hypothetical protein